MRPRYISLHQRAEDTDVRGSGASALFTGSLQKLDLRRPGRSSADRAEGETAQGQEMVSSNATYEREREE